jgi:hypothetical protein
MNPTRTRLPISFLILVALVPFSGAQSPQPGFADAILGRWDLTIITGDQSYPSWVEFTLRKETELMGRFVGRSGSARHITQIDYRNGELMFRVPVQYEPNSSDLVFKGNLAGDKLEGTTEGARGNTIAWSGVRAPALRRSNLPAWGAPTRLFNGTNLRGWRLRGTARGDCWKVENGSLVNTVPCVDIITERKFRDFKLHLEFNIVEKSNSGIYLRGRYEVQIQDDIGKAMDSLRMGGIYGFLKPNTNAARRPDEWQTCDATLIGRRVTVVLNRKRIIEYEEIPGITGGALDSNEGEPGPIMLQGDHGRIRFRNIVITPAPDRGSIGPKWRRI